MNAQGENQPKAITKNGKVLRYAGIPSPDGKWMAYDDLENNMFILNLANGKSKKSLIMKKASMIFMVARQ